jgi:hypothetical protein
MEAVERIIHLDRYAAFRALDFLKQDEGKAAGEAQEPAHTAARSSERLERCSTAPFQTWQRVSRFSNGAESEPQHALQTHGWTSV